MFPDALAWGDGSLPAKAPYLGPADLTPCELLSETLDPFLADLRRRANLGLVEAAGVTATGIVAGLCRSRAPEDGTVVAYAGPDTITEFADQALRDAAEQGVPIPTDAAERYWPEWSSLG